MARAKIAAAPARRSSARKSTASRRSASALSSVLPASRTSSAMSARRLVFIEIGGRAREWPRAPPRPCRSQSVAAPDVARSACLDRFPPRPRAPRRRQPSDPGATVSWRWWPRRRRCAADQSEPHSPAPSPAAAATMLPKRVARAPVPQRDSRGVAARRKDRARQRNARMRDGRQRLDLRDRIGDDLVDRRLVVGQAVDEGGVGAVFEQPAHQIGEQILMAADRRIDAAGLLHLCRPDDLAHKAPGPCHAGAGTRNGDHCPAMTEMAASVWALWVANCG